MKKILRAAALSATALLLAGCSTYTGEATVTGTFYDDPDTVTTFMKVGDVMVPNISTYPERWVVVAETAEGDSIELNVPEPDFTSYRPGDRVNVVDGELGF